MSLDDVEAMSLAEVGEDLKANASHAEDVECFCINPYIYADLDDESYTDKRGPAWSQCVGDVGERKPGWSQHGIRCNEICEDKKKYVRFEGVDQTLSFCGNDNGGLTGKIECQCLDGTETYQNRENQKIAQKRYQKGKIDSPNTLWMLKVKHNFNSEGSSQGNLKNCYTRCPNICRQHEMVIGGCAMPAHA
eukprot:CAMPEP_0197650518 /NCGR_PEP_ID=MMETSP1338-20131121/30993_1 /TAXON_ID=43686 ORGANISM="Pelagodinium beii, Strain RCC1491" /NCGR_SAMPLE_ID=MMETSP1338 /ASSEMBLY_ACC=CAM_ASM_000754 /LENGTH=190 /DNA_ID=CAMNT_0043224941 /DNA_START=179 /DNA_END=751 /DNA_ORIENTATION=+